MPAVSTKGLMVYLSKASGTPVTITPTAISSAKPAVVTAAAITGVAKGDILAVSQTGFPELDGKTFVAGAVTGTTVELIGSDTTGTTGTLGATPEITAYVAADQVKLCLSSLTIDPPSPSTIDTSTYCAPSSILGTATPGSISMGGYLDETDLGLAEVVVADTDGQPRYFQVVLPGTLGYLVGKVSFAGLSFGVPLEGAVAFSVSGSQNEKITWIH